MVSSSSATESTYDQIETAKDSILADLATRSTNKNLLSPRVLIICGSGLGGIGEILQGETVAIAYQTIPYFKSSTVEGHAGKLLFGEIGPNKVPVMCMVGRLHFYEGYSFDEATFPVRVAASMGAQILLVTNAAGGINPAYKPGDLMIISDHLNLPGVSGYHPLRGPNLDKFGPRFLPLSDAYDFDLRLEFVKQAKQVLKLSRTIHEGTYCYVAGPSYETRAEVRFIRTIGGDSVGMSTVPEVIVARHSNMKVLGLSLITNAGLGTPPVSALEFLEQKQEDSQIKDQQDGMASHEEVLESANSASKDVNILVEAFINAVGSV
ncbi:hypothetical protein OGAPHI_001940 [Ogataea philodendri]|uniref:Purine nucleoside phosphorylase n=2 Tax=Saccharomycotina TaxID=147537 RepID=A0A9P8PAI5_9ASCO|nr:uncharacterized protein OGAPHI_001940 [Ogataea philodendri]KAH3668186.1 hypothetical protein OGAPHI_001940 [Ogataea philodendri]